MLFRKALIRNLEISSFLDAVEPVVRFGSEGIVDWSGGVLGSSGVVDGGTSAIGGGDVGLRGIGSSGTLVRSLLERRLGINGSATLFRDIGGCETRSRCGIVAGIALAVAATVAATAVAASSRSLRLSCLLSDFRATLNID